MKVQLSGWDKDGHETHLAGKGLVASVASVRLLPPRCGQQSVVLLLADHLELTIGYRGVLLGTVGELLVAVG